ncbi:MAG: hypothetical protein ACYTHN_19325 [Planctomycetota bacterium]|jgi:hypothetical protein
MAKEPMSIARKSPRFVARIGGTLLLLLAAGFLIPSAALGVEETESFLRPPDLPCLEPLDPAGNGEASITAFLGWGRGGWQLALEEDKEYEPMRPSLDDEDPLNPQSELLDRGYRNPWIAALASLVLPGAGQFYNAVTPYAYTLRGFQFWMFAQGGVHGATVVFTILFQFVGLRMESTGPGGALEITERTAQAWRIVHVFNAVLASVSAYLEAQLINRSGRRYVFGLRARAFFDPAERATGVEVGVLF